MTRPDLNRNNILNRHTRCAVMISFAWVLRPGVHSVVGIATERAKTQGCQEVDESEAIWSESLSQARACGMIRLLLMDGTFIHRNDFSMHN